MCTHTSSSFGKYFVLSVLVSQPLIVAGPSTLFPLLVNGYYADGTFQRDQIVDSHLQVHLWPQSSTSLQLQVWTLFKQSHDWVMSRQKVSRINPSAVPRFQTLTINRNNIWCLLLPYACVYCGRTFARLKYCSLRYHGKRKDASSWAAPTSFFEQVPVQTIFCTHAVYVTSGPRCHTRSFYNLENTN